MHEKEVSIRRSLRQSQLNEIKMNIRGNLILSYQMEQEVMQNNLAIEKLIDQNDLTSLVQLIQEQNLKIMDNLNEKLIIKCFCYLRKNIDDVTILVLLKKLIQNHFITIFADESKAEENKLFVNEVYQKVDHIIKKLMSSQMEYDGALSLGVSQLLQILKQFYYRLSYNRGSNSYSVLEINNPYNLAKFIFPWLPYLLRNQHYLAILSRIIDHSCIFGNYSQFFGIVMTNLQLFDTLVSNICKCGDEWQCSFSILRHVFQNCVLSEQFVKTNLNDYWFLVMSKLIQDYNKKLNSLAHNFLFQGFQSLDHLLLVLTINNTDIKGSSFLFQSQYYQLLFKLLPYQSDKNRQLLYLIIHKSIEILTCNRQTLLDYINIKSFHAIVSDLTNNINHRLVTMVLKIVYQLLRSSHMSCDTYQLLMQYLLQNGIDQVLQILKFHKNREISKIAMDLLENEFKQQNYEYDAMEMDIEPRFGGL